MPHPARRVVPALCVLLVAVGAVWMWATHDVPAEPGADAPSDTADGPATAERHRARAPEADEGDAPEPESADDPPAEPEPDAPEVRRVRVVDEDRRPVPGARVSWERDGRQRSDGADADGVVEVPVHDGDDPEVEVFDGSGNRTLVLEEPLTEVVVSLYPVIELVAIDAWTGKSVPVEGADATVTVGDDTTDVTLGASAVRAWRLPLGPDRRADLRVALRPAAGWVAVPEFAFEGVIPLSTKRARLTVPVFPETSRTVRAVDATGAPVEGAIVTEVSVPWGGRREIASLPLIRVRAPAAGPDGRIVIDGLPRLPRGKLTIEVAAGSRMSRSFGAVDVATTEPSADEVLDVDVTAGRVHSPLLDSPRDDDDDFGGFCGTRDEPTRVSVRAFGRDGRPAAGVHVRLGGDSIVTGTDGTGECDRVESGRYRFVAWGESFLPAFGEFETGGDAPLTVHEGTGRQVRVTVLDAASRPVPWARVTAHVWCLLTPDGRPWPVSYRVAQTANGRDELAPRTGADGSVVLVVPRGRLWFDASFLGEFGRMHSVADEVQVVLGETPDTDDWMSPEMNAEMERMEAEWEQRERERKERGEPEDGDGESDR